MLSESQSATNVSPAQVPSDDESQLVLGTPIPTTTMPSDFFLLRAHMRSLEPAPKRKPSEKLKMGVHLGTCAHWNVEHGYGFISPDAPAAIPEIKDRDLYVGNRSLQRSGIKFL